MSALARRRVPSCASALPPRIRLRNPAFSTFIALNARRVPYSNTGFTSSYDPTQDASRGPIFDKAAFGVPQFYPRDLKRRVDDYVVGQERAKKTICSVIFNHYQSLRRRQHHDTEDQRLREKLQRQSRRQAEERYQQDEERARHNDFSRGSYQLPEEPPDSSADPFHIPDVFDAPPHVKIDKSNLLLLGPTGVGKTYILETLSKKLNVPFAISDCNAFTQAGYIGQDVEACIERLLIEANYDVEATEHGIVVLDEFDKIARRETINGRDVGGEGVQQALLKLVEGTKITVNVKDHRSSRSTAAPSNSYGSSSPSQPSSSVPPSSAPASGKVEQFIIDTTNILFVFCGAFVGLDKTVLRRVSKRSMGFGSEIRSLRNSSLPGAGEDILPRAMYNHLPHQPAVPSESVAAPAWGGGFTPLDLTTPADLQAFGFIPELIGRMHNICALTPLSLDELYRILTEPVNCLVAQYVALFETYPSRLFFTRRALLAIAERAAKNETGARGLKMEMERVLAEPMFDAPTPYVLITEGCVGGTEKARYWGKDGRLELERVMRDEDERPAESAEPDATFEQFREAGQSGA
ncbi:P-loop containing nucleoside triphosphate hydrolase protein [Lasiosphaeria miniovina]|uniref:P-loop containing nucleoside triphosphate hydrolase protein n=1 Tax=Lasiosphaeria miniovina TaxID=1954250 RepID=A0AA39ZZM7_9PEZI|nr:P-loop containing nucleoside triphosphate hydrolase protein [Lasiosphaeria miniovina]KAK0706591.1 P-loop containing nucleoside triphosphate hydrolase protein [Lasiosphaeria miniovina]